MAIPGNPFPIGEINAGEFREFLQVLVKMVHYVSDNLRCKSGSVNGLHCGSSEQAIDGSGNQSSDHPAGLEPGKASPKDILSLLGFRTMQNPGESC